MSLELRDEFDPGFNRWEWRIQRADWFVLAVLMVAAIAGLFGGGFLSQATARSHGQGYEVVLEYPRFGRAESTLELALQVMAVEQGASELRVTLSGEFVDRAAITGISPEPDTEAPLGGRVVYTWAIEDWSQPLAIRLEYESRDWRTLSGAFDVETDAGPLGRVTFSQFLFP